MEVRIEGRGMDVLMRKMERAGAFDKSRAMRSALSDAANLVAGTGKQTLAPRLKGTGRGSLILSIRARVKRRKAGALAGFTRSTAAHRAAAAGNHAHLVDLGTRQRQGRGVMPANWFWTDAVAASSGRAMRIVQDGVKVALDEALNR